METSPADSGFIKLSMSIEQPSGETIHEQMEAQKELFYREMFNYPVNVLRNFRDKNKDQFRKKKTADDTGGHVIKENERI